MAKRDPLSQYRAKRDFARSPEPAGKVASRRTPAARVRRRKPAGKRFFCVQKHLASRLHYDFRLEHNGVLLSWAIPKGPSLRPADKRLAMEVEAHPLDYGEFEGVIPEGYGAGVVMLWDRGVWEPEQADVDSAIANGELKFRLEGVKLKGSWALVRTGRPERGWLLIKHRDEWVGDVDVLTVAPLSVKSFGDLADILAAEKPQVWQSHLSARGGTAGEALREVIAEAGRRLAARKTK